MKNVNYTISYKGMTSRHDGSVNPKLFLKGPIVGVELHVNGHYIGLINLGSDGKFFFNDLKFVHEFANGLLRLFLEKQGDI